MKKIIKYITIFSLTFLCRGLHAQTHPTMIRANRTSMVKTDTTPHIITRPPMVTPKPIIHYKYIGVQTSKYANEINQVYQPANVIPGSTSIPEAERATYGDSAMLTTTINSVLDVVRNNYTESIDAYVDTVRELDNIKKLEWINSRVRKTDIYGLVTNLSLLKSIFEKETFDKEDVEMISYLFGTNDSIIRNMRIVNYDMLMSFTGLTLALVLADSLNNPIPVANCYFLLKSTWRSLQNCNQCPYSVTGQPCTSEILNELEQRNDGKIQYNSTTPQQDVVQLPYGPYHLLIAIDGNIYYHEVKDMDVNTPVSLAINLP